MAVYQTDRYRGLAGLVRAYRSSFASGGEFLSNKILIVEHMRFHVESDVLPEKHHEI